MQIRTSDPEADFRQGEMLTEFPIAGYHYFCESVDITRPFPSSHAASDPCWEFVWNCYLTQPFRRVGIGSVAPHMLQGLAEQRSLPDLLGKLFGLVLMARRSRLHAGTRCGISPSRGGPPSRAMPPMRSHRCHARRGASSGTAWRLRAARVGGSRWGSREAAGAQGRRSAQWAAVA